MQVPAGGGPRVVMGNDEGMQGAEVWAAYVEGVYPDWGVFL